MTDRNPGWHAGPVASDAGRGVVVAVLDAGLAPHPGIPDVQPDDYRSFAGSRGDPTGHGTASAGLVAAMAPAARLVIAACLSDRLEADDAALREAFDWALGRGAQVVLFGLGRQRSWGAPPDAAWCALVAGCGALVVAPAGNGSRPERPEAVREPAACPGALAVAAVDRGGAPWVGNARDDGVAGIDVFAPGVGVLAPHPDGRYVEITGTSAAAAVVAGQAAALLGRRPSLSVSALAAALVAGAR